MTTAVRSLRSTMRRLAWSAPPLALGLIFTFSLVLPNRTVLDESADAHKAAVALALGQAPYLIGDWSGQDDDVPPEAQKLLRPNAVFSRRYTNLRTSQAVPWVHVLIVHCNDARDMYGHYPPVCYPNTGWEMTQVEGSAEAVLSVGAASLPVRVYEFRRTFEFGRAERYRILNAFILPEGTVTYRIEDVGRKSERLAVAGQGVAQVQFITDASVDPQDAIDAVGQVLDGLRGVFQALQLKTGSQS